MNGAKSLSGNDDSALFLMLSVSVESLMPENKFAGRLKLKVRVGGRMKREDGHINRDRQIDT